MKEERKRPYLLKWEYLRSGRLGESRWVNLAPTQAHGMLYNLNQRTNQSGCHYWMEEGKLNLRAGVYKTIRVIGSPSEVL